MRAVVAHNFQMRKRCGKGYRIERVYTLSIHYNSHILKNMTRNKSLFYFIFAIISCDLSKEKHSNIPTDISQIENLIVYSTVDEQYENIELLKESIFESNEEIFIDGYISTVAVDKKNRIFIGANNPGTSAIYIFDSDGSFLKKLSKKGRGPGEFESIDKIEIVQNKLYVFGPRLQKIGIFSLEDFSHQKDILINKENIKAKSEFQALMRATDFYVNSDESIVVQFVVHSLTHPNKFTKTEYYKVDNKGYVIPKLILEQDRFKFNIIEKSDKIGYDLPFTTPFARNSIVASNKNGKIYTVWTEEFLIKRYDWHGNYEKAFYYPIKRSALDVSTLDLGEERLKVIKKNGVPETWPAVHAIQADDKERIWVATITDSETTFKWWLLDQEGELLGVCTIPGKRSKRNVFAGASLTVIKNNYFYAHEFDFEKEIDRIVKYKVVFKER